MDLRREFVLAAVAPSCPPGLQCYPTSAEENRCFDRPLFPTCSGAALCEDFEGDMLGGWFLINYNQSTLKLDGTRVHTGKQSLHAGVRPHDPNAPPPNNISQAQVTQAVSVAPDIFMRFFINQSSIFPNFVEIAAL